MLALQPGHKDCGCRADKRQETDEERTGTEQHKVAQGPNKEVDRVCQAFHNKDHFAPRRKNLTTHPPLYHEHHKKRHNWPNLEGRINNDSKLMWDQHQQQWTFIWVYESKVTSHESQVEGLHICSLDPGVRTFMTW
ncbi:9414_t:CDS:2 [Ambispora gerdemannii]|uniref:9414_t:CDS:1 n=1 Tax=Ambispora gerdemannii TaxID=144530 RepID=A0A9N8Z2K7_9GLOM|nr:9414_t:CDS:2 [Ambispora gerdemannii]